VDTGNPAAAALQNWPMICLDRLHLLDWGAREAASVYEMIVFVTSVHEAFSVFGSAIWPSQQV
jgi:hypothetical protein